MAHLPTLNVVGVMTGNSLDGVDTVLTEFSENGGIRDTTHISQEISQELREQLLALRQAVTDAKGFIEEVEILLAQNGHVLSDIHDNYLNLVGKTIKALIKKSDNAAIDLIGFHGQTCGHLPPSLAKYKDQTYTIQFGNGQQLADLIDIPVVYDFRSDDIFNGGEGAPLAPTHHLHLAYSLQDKTPFPIAFCNAGNTGNISLIAEHTTLGWDTGPFNNYPDKLMRAEKGLVCDKDGQFGGAGIVNLQLLELLFQQAARTPDGQNFLLMPPPKSSDPQWYENPNKLFSMNIPFEDKIRTAEYFAAYCFIHSLTQLPHEGDLPGTLILCGGGWKNPVTLGHFKGLVSGDYANNPILPEHKDIFHELYLKDAIVDFARAFGFDGTSMEARVFADAAVCRIKGAPFTTPETTGAHSETVCGVLRFPDRQRTNCSETLKRWIAKFESLSLTQDHENYDSFWSRACAGWLDNFAQSAG